MSQSHTKEIREQIDALIAERRWPAAHARLADFWQREGKAGVASYILSCYDKMRAHMELVPCRVAFLRSMTVEPIVPILRAAALVSGIDATVHVGEFNSYPQEILDSNSALYSFNPDVAVLAVQTRDIAPEIWEQYPESSEPATQAVVARLLNSFATWVRVFRERTNASLIIHNLEKPVASQGVLETQRPNGQLTAIDQINAGLRAMAAGHRGVYILDYDALVAQHGSLRWHDEAKWLTMRMPFATDSLLPMANAWLKFLHPIAGVVCKVLVLDLDNTLWGGVLGEDGMDGIKIGIEYPGANYRSFQRAILDLYYRGVLLAVCSKNNPDEAMAALQNHPGMLLRPGHFAAFRINWQNKAQNIRELAAELNLGIDSFAFFDDNPVERELIRSEIPEVKVIAVPDQAQKYAQTLREFPHFQRLSLSDEDQRKTQQYHEQNKRTELAQSAGSLEDFFRSLDQEVVIARVTSESLARVAQLTQKTNQYNVTTRRYTEQQIQEFLSRPEYGVYSVQVKDRFGDNGIVGVLVTHTAGDICEIDTFLLSCRVIGRTIETAMLGFLTDASKADGASILQGWFLPTKKNAPVRELYPAHKFQPVTSQDGATLWSLNLEQTQIPFPEWIRMNVADNSHRADEPRA
jgi:FkbH-like protein